MILVFRERPGLIWTTSGFIVCSLPNRLRYILLPSRYVGITSESNIAPVPARLQVSPLRRETETGKVGSYYITDLIPGTYTITVEKPGFKSSVLKNIFVQAAANSTANAVLSVGNARETVEVTAPEISLETEQALLGTTIPHKFLEELPQLLVGTVRQLDTLLCLAPGLSVPHITHATSSPHC